MSRSILPLPTQPILLTTPLAKEPELVEPVSKDEKGKDEKGKEKTQARNSLFLFLCNLINQSSTDIETPR